MARRRFHAMTRSGVSIRLIPTALFLDAALSPDKANLGNAIATIAANPSSAAQTLSSAAGFSLKNIGGIAADVILALIWTKVFPRTPGIRLGRFRVSL